MWPFTSRNIGLLAQISYILCQLLLCSCKSQLSNYANAHCYKNINITLAYVIMSRLIYVMTYRHTIYRCSPTIDHHVQCEITVSVFLWSTILYSRYFFVGQNFHGTEIYCITESFHGLNFRRLNFHGNKFSKFIYWHSPSSK